ncbi:MAG: DUF4097 family beta strand repeat-containing protein [Jiangellaceae bacterium]
MTIDYPQTFPVTGPLALSVRLSAGDVQVTAAEVTEAVVDLRPVQADDPDALDVIARTRVFYRSGSNALRVDVPRGRGVVDRNPPIEMRVTVPAGSSADVEVGSADVRIEGRTDVVTIQAGSGDVAVDCCKRARIKSGSGDVHIDEVETSVVKSGSGNLVVRRSAGDVDLQTASGDIRLGQLGGNANLSTASGDIELGSSAHGVGAKTASGDFTVGRAVEGEIEVRTASGDVTIGVADGTAARLECSSVSGSVRSQLEPADAPGDAERRLVIAARSVSGSITVNRAS